MGKNSKNLSVVARADLVLTHQDGVGFVLMGQMEAHHDSIIGTQKGQKIEIGGNLEISEEGDGVKVIILAGGITLEGIMRVSGLTAEQILFLRGKKIPEAVLAGASG